MKKTKSGVTRWLLELALTACVTMALVILARPLGDPSNTNGLNGRYLPETSASVMQQSNSLGQLASRMSEAQQSARTIWVMTNTGQILALWAGAGLISLWLGRLPLSAAMKLPLIAFVWAWAARFSQPQWRDANEWTQVYLVLGALTLVGLLMHLRQVRKMLLQVQQSVAPWIFPGFVALTGIGLIWLLDLSARGYPKFRYIGLNHYDALFIGFVTFSIVAALAPVIAITLLRAISWFDAATTRVRRLISAFFIAAGLVAVTVIVYRHSAPYLTSELLRAPFYVVLAWTLYRWGDVSAHPIRAVGIIASSTALFTAGMLGTHDLGPLLVFALTACVLASVPATHALANRGLGVSGLFAGIFCSAILLGVVTWMLFNVAPIFSTRAAGRVAALINPHQAATEYLSQLEWLRAATPLGGFGLGATPWCGYLGAIGGPCNGVPQQTQSDYTFAGLAAIWGLQIAAAITACCALWLAGLVFARRPAREQIADPGLFIAWLILVWACGTLMQLLVTVLGTLGHIPLTGVTYPFVAWGKVSLLVNCAFAGLAVNRTLPRFMSKTP